LRVEEREGRGCSSSYAQRRDRGGAAVLVRPLLAVMDLAGDINGSNDDGGGSGQ
jgi:hypothetical protein